MSEIETALARQVGSSLGSRCIATAESVTAGRIAAALACAESAEEFLRGGVVTYQTCAKRALLDVTTPGVLSTTTVEQMAAGVARLMGVEVAVATSGLAGGEPREGVPPGTVFIATFVDGRSRGARYRFDGPPEVVCRVATQQALRDVLDALASAGQAPAATGGTATEFAGADPGARRMGGPESG